MNRAFVFLAVLLIPGIALAASFDISGPSLAGIDAPGGASTGLLVSGFPGEVVTDLNLRVGQSGPYAADIDISLTHGAVTVLVFDATTDSGGSMDATFDDEAGSGAPHTGTITGTFLPDNPLSAFDGMPVDGTWTISFSDTIFAGDGDGLTAWSIFGTTSPVPEPATITLFGLGLAGFAFFSVRRRRRRATRP